MLVTRGPDSSNSSVEPGEVNFEQGAAANSIYVIDVGVMGITRDGPVRHHRSGRQARENFGEIGMMTGSQRTITMKALTPVRVPGRPGSCLHQLSRSNEVLNEAMKPSVREKVRQA